MVDDSELMRLFSAFVQWQSYAATTLATAELEERDALHQLKSREAMAMIENWDAPKETATKVKAAARSDPGVIQAEERVTLAVAQRKLTQVVYENCERTSNFLSRELSRRIGRDGPDRRQQRWNP